jgi:hypothetical protein
MPQCKLQTLDRRCDNLHQTKGNLNDYTHSINKDHPKWQVYCKVKKSLNEHNALTQQLLSELDGSLQISTREELHYKTMNSVVKKILGPNPCTLTKKLIVFPFCANKHWMATFVFDASFILTFCSKTTNKRRNLVTTFLRYCPYHPRGSANMPMQHGLLVLLNQAFSFAEHCKLPLCADVPMKMRDVNHSCFGEYLRGSQYFPRIRLSVRSWMTMQIDTYNCGVGTIATVATILRDVVGRNSQHHERFCNSFAR